MRAGILPLFLALCTPIETLGDVIPVLNMCSKTTNSSRELILFKNSMDLTNTSSDVCSCNLQSKNDFYISVKRLKLTNNIDDVGNKVFGITPNVTPWDLNLAETNTNLTTSDCLVISGNISGPFRPSCLRNIGTPNITLETFNNLTEDSYIYLYILSEGTVNISCTLKNESYILDTGKENQTAARCSNQSSSSNTTDVTDSNCDNTTVSESDSTTDGRTATSFASVTSSTSTSGPNLTVYDFYRSAVAKQQEAERMMTASMIMLPIAGIALLACLFILVMVFRKQRYSKKTHSIKRKGSTRKVQKQEPPSYYEEVDEDLHISTNGPEITKDEHSSNIQTSGTEYDVANSIGVKAKGKSFDNVSALNSQNYDVATAISPQGVISLNTSGNDDSDYNVASYNPQKKTSSAGVDGTYDVTQCVVMDKIPGDSDGMIYETGIELDNLDQSNDLAVGVSQESLISSEIHYEPAEMKSASNSVPSVQTLPKDVDVYSLEKIVSVEEKPDGIKDKEVIYDNHEKNMELQTSDERVSFATDVLDDELYANFSSLKSEDHESVEILEEDPSNFEEDEDDIYINHAMPGSGRKDSLESLQNTKRTSFEPESNPTKCPGYINVTLAQPKENLTPELTDSSDAAGNENESFQSQGFGVTGSTVSLLNSDSDSEIYANFKAGEDNSKEPKKGKFKAKNTKEPKESRSSGQCERKRVEVVVLPQPSTSTVGDAPPRQPQTKGHKQSSSVDESSKFQRKPDSRKQRTRSDDTLLLNQIPSSTSGSENDVMMVNNVMYEGLNTGSPNPNAEFSNEAIANLSSDTDLDQYIFLQKDDNEDEDIMIMMNNDLYESFSCGGVCLLPENVSQEMKDKLQKKKLHALVNENSFTESEKL